MKRKILFVTFVLIFCIFNKILSEICFGEPRFVLEVLVQKNDLIIFQREISSQEVFYINTIHSLAKTPYKHIYKFDEKGNIILSGAIFESEGGGGFPFAGDGVFTIVNGKFMMDNMDRFIGKLRFRVSPISKETFCISNIEIPLYKIVPEGTLIIIRIFQKLHTK